MTQARKFPQILRRLWRAGRAVSDIIKGGCGACWGDLRLFTSVELRRPLHAHHATHVITQQDIFVRHIIQLKRALASQLLDYLILGLEPLPFHLKALAKLH